LSPSPSTAIRRPEDATGSRGGASQRVRPPRVSLRAREITAAYLFLAPDLVGLAVFVAVPTVAAIVVGFFADNGFGQYTYIGWANYQRMMHDPVFLQSIRVTFIYELAFVPALFFSSLGLALLVRRPRRGIGVVRAILFSPSVVSLIVVGIIWQFLLIAKVGIVDRITSAVGLGDPSWLGVPDLALTTVILVSVWFFAGYYMLIFLAGLQDIPVEYYESARIDGASRWTTFWRITWPLLAPTRFFVLMLATITGIGGFQAFDLIYIMTAGGPANSTSVIIFYIYQTAFKYDDIGYASAMASLVAVALLVVTLIVFRISRRGGRLAND
jgi:multiple sugar transport system permease protein